VYCIVNPTTNKLHRVTFSKSLADLIIETLGDEYEMRTAKFVRTRRLAPNEKSDGLYGVVATKKDLVLRVPMTKELASIYAEDDSRHIEEVFLEF